MANSLVPANYAEICDKTDCSRHAYHRIESLGILDSHPVEQYQCQSYYNDNKLQDCTCGRCK